MDAMILAAGYGERLKPFTNDKPKALVEVSGKPLLAHHIDHLLKIGFDNIVVNAFYLSEQVVDFINKNPVYRSYVTVVVEPELLNTGAGIQNASRYFHLNQPILIHNVDVFSDIDLVALYQEHKDNKNMATLAVSERESDRKLLFNTRNKLCGWRNLKTEQQIIKRYSRMLIPYAFSGIHIIDAGLITMMPEADKPYSIIDFYLNQCYHEKIECHVHDAQAWLDVGTPEKLALLQARFE